MLWVLLFVTSVHGHPPDIKTHEFETLLSCRVGGALLEETVRKATTSARVNVEFLCVGKGDLPPETKAEKK